MKKLFIIGMILYMIPINLFAYSTCINNIQSIEQEKYVSTSFLHISSGQELLSYFKEHEYFPVYLHQNKFYDTLLTREFAVFLVLYEQGISFPPDVFLFQENNESIFSDIDKNSFFANYIVFAQQNNIIDGYENGEFRPKNFITKEEFQKIIVNVFGENREYILQSYNEKKHNEEDMNFFSAGENIQNIIPLNVIKNQIQSIIPFHSNVIYEAIKDEGKILPIIQNGEIFFPEIKNIDKYILYFDYSGKPFLSQKTDYITHEEIENILIHLINEYRKENGVQAAEKSIHLGESAKKYAQKMFETKYFEHIDQEGKNAGDRALETGYDYELILENLGKGQKEPGQVFYEWKQSPLHNKNLLHQGVKEIGIGFYGNYWVQLFGNEL